MLILKISTGNLNKHHQFFGDFSNKMAISKRNLYTFKDLPCPWLLSHNQKEIRGFRKCAKRPFTIGGYEVAN